MERTHRDLSARDTAHIFDTYHTWRGGDGIGDYAGFPGFCKSVALEGILRHGWVLVWGRYVSGNLQPYHGDIFQEKMGPLEDTVAGAAD